MRCESCGKKLHPKREQVWTSWSSGKHPCDYCFHHCEHSVVGGVEKWECKA